MSDAPVNSTTIASVRAVLFITCMYMLMAITGLVGLVPAILSRRACLRIMKSYVTAMRWLLRVICRLHCEIRGPVPDQPCIIAAKHQSFLDVMLLTEILPDPRFVMKRTILYMPLLGYYARRMGCIAIDRGRGTEAIRDIAAAAHGETGQLIVYPQGTRVTPGASAPYLRGAAHLARRTGLPIMLAATNAGWFWPRSGLRRSPGVAVIEFLGALPTDGRTADVSCRMAEVIEAASDRLGQEAADGLTGSLRAKGPSDPRH